MNRPSLKHNHARSNAHNDAHKINHSVLEYPNGMMKLLCKRGAIFKAGTLVPMAPEKFIRKCDLCEKAVAEYVAIRVQGKDGVSELAGEP